DIDLLEAARGLPAKITTELSKPRSYLERSNHQIHQVLQSADEVLADTLSQVSQDYGYAADWLEDKARNHPLIDHMDAFFADRVLGDLAGDLRLTKIALDGALNQNQAPSPSRLLQLHN